MSMTTKWDPCYAIVCIDLGINAMETKKREFEQNAQFSSYDE